MSSLCFFAEAEKHDLIIFAAPSQMGNRTAHRKHRLAEGPHSRALPLRCEEDSSTRGGVGDVPIFASMAELV